MSKRVLALMDSAMKTAEFAKEIAGQSAAIRTNFFGQFVEEGEGNQTIPTPPLGTIGRLQEQIESIARNLKKTNDDFHVILREFADDEDKVDKS
jgi:hypothetical protein